MLPIFIHKKSSTNLRFSIFCSKNNPNNKKIRKNRPELNNHSNLSTEPDLFTSNTVICLGKKCQELRVSWYLERTLHNLRYLPNGAEKNFGSASIN